MYDDDIFSPEQVDEQIERLPGSLPHEDARLVSDLHTVYQPLAHSNTRSLERVRARLAQHETRTRLSHGNASSIPFHQTRQQKNKKDRNMKMTMTAQEGTWQRRLGLIAAVFFVALLVGSLLLVFELARQSKNVTHHSNAATTGSNTGQIVVDTSPSSPGIYLTAQKDRDTFQIIKLDTQTRKQLWSQNIGTITMRSTIVVVGKTVYFSSANADLSQNYVYALNAETGAVRWHINLGNSQYSQKELVPTPAGGTVVRATPSTGNNVLSYTLGILSTPVVDNGVVYVTGESGKLFALNATDGTQLWMYDTQTVPIGESGTRYDVEKVAVDQGVIYGSIMNKLYAIDTKTHRALWTIQIDKTQILHAPEVVNGIVYTSSYEQSHHTSGASMTGYVYAFNAKDGTQRWKFTAQSWVLSSPVVVNDIVYFGSYDQHVYALKANDGTKLWSVDTGGHVYDEPTVSNGVVYADETGNASEATSTASTVKPAMFAIDASSGKVLWQQNTSQDSSIEAVQGNVIYTGVFPGTVYAYDTKTGKTLWHQQVGTLLKDKLGEDSAPAPIITVVG